MPLCCGCVVINGASTIAVMYERSNNCFVLILALSILPTNCTSGYLSPDLSLVAFYTGAESRSKIWRNDYTASESKR